MIQETISIFRFRLTLLIFTALFAAACSEDNPVQPDDTDHGHAEAEGAVLSMKGSTVVRVDSGIVTGEISVLQKQTSDLISVRFINEQRELFTPAGEHHLMALEIADTTVATTRIESGEKWVFRLTGKTSGQTTLVLKLMHGDHADFRTPPVTVLVQ